MYFIYIGKIRDITGTYRYNFIIGGSILAALSVIYILISIALTFFLKKEEEKCEEIVIDVKA